MVVAKDQPVYLLAGSEQFLKEENLSRIKSAFLDQETESFNFNIFYADTTPLKKVIECAHTVPFLARKRVVLVRQIEDLSASDRELLLSYVKTPQRSSCLVLETQETNLNQNFFAEIYRYAKVIFCKPFQERQLFAWIKARVAAQGKRIEEKAQGVLVDNLGNDLQLLSGALDSLTLYIGQKETIKAGDIEKLVGPDLPASVFALFDAVLVRDKAKVLQILDSLLKDGINSSQILGALTHQIVSERNRLNFSQFERSIEELQKADTDIKTGRQTQKTALELLMARLLQIF